MVDDARASLLATLAADRERRQQLDTAPDSAAKRKQDRDALIERLLQERRERQERQQALPPSAADGAAPGAPRAAPPRMAWEENLDRNELRLEHELGLPSTRARAHAADVATGSDTASLSDLPPPHYPEAYLDGCSLAPDEPDGDLPEGESSLSLSLEGAAAQGLGEVDGKAGAGEEGEAAPDGGAVVAPPDGSSLEELIARADAVMEGYYAEHAPAPAPAPAPTPAPASAPAPAAGQSARVAEARERVHGAGAADARSVRDGSTDPAVRPRGEDIQPPHAVDALPQPASPSLHAPPQRPTAQPPSHTAAAPAAAAAAAAGTRTPASKKSRGGATTTAGREGGGPAAGGRGPKAEADAPPPFQPSINPRSAALASARQGDCYSRLATQRADEFAKREERRLAAEERRLAECTFTPRLTPQMGSKSRSKTAAHAAERGSRPAGERLHRDGEARAELRERRALASEAWEVASFPFAPHINERPAGSAPPSRPLHERLEEEVARRESKLQALRQKHAETEATFQPHIDPHSAAISLAAAQPFGSELRGGSSGHGCGGSGLGGGGGSSLGRGDIAERLTAEGAVTAQRHAEREAAVRAAESRQCPFHPVVNPLSERLVNAGCAEGRDVYERQARHLHMVEEKRKQREEAEAREQQRLFRPAISDASAILLEARPERQRESEQDKVDRLAYVDAQRREGLRLQLQAAAHEQCTFRPQIDAISARLARAKTDAERSSNSRGRERRERLVRDYEQQALAECTFHPKVDARSESLAGQSGVARAPLKGELAHELTRRLEAQQLERDARLERSRREAEHARLKECTFAPKLHRPKSEKEEGRPVVVRGLGRYMELKDMAKRQAEAQKQREQKAFIVTPPTRLQPFTVPEPFNLSEPRHDERGAARLRELAEHEMQECTFAPKTNEASATQLLARVMQHAACKA